MSFMMIRVRASGRSAGGSSSRNLSARSVIEVDRQLLAAFSLLREVGDHHFFVGRALRRIPSACGGPSGAAAPGAVLLPARPDSAPARPAAPPGQHSTGAGSVHFPRARMVSPCSSTRRPIGSQCETQGQATDHAGAKQQLMADYRVGGVVCERKADTDWVPSLAVG